MPLARKRSAFGRPGVRSRGSGPTPTRIYLFHVFPAAGARIALGRIGITEPLLVFAVALAAGLAAPVVAELVLRRSRPLRRVLLGLR